MIKHIVMIIKKISKNHFDLFSSIQIRMVNLYIYHYYFDHSNDCDGHDDDIGDDDGTARYSIIHFLTSKF